MSEDVKLLEFVAFLRTRVCFPVIFEGRERSQFCLCKGKEGVYSLKENFLLLVEVKMSLRMAEVRNCLCLLKVQLLSFPVKPKWCGMSWQVSRGNGVSWQRAKRLSCPSCTGEKQNSLSWQKANVLACRKEVKILVLAKRRTSCRVVVAEKT